MQHLAPFPVVEHTPTELIQAVLPTDRRVLLFGEPGVGKSTLASALANKLTELSRDCWCLGADPGSPGFGIPGAVCLGLWERGEWRMQALEALCTLNAARFRLPLVERVRLLARQVVRKTLFVDAPGVVRGAPGGELLAALVDAASIDVVLVLTRSGKSPPLLDELRALPTEVVIAYACAGAHRPGKRTRARRRTHLWEDYLRSAEPREFALEAMQLLGTPPPLDVPEAWQGRQVALLEAGRTVTVGEVLALKGSVLRARMAPAGGEGTALLVRDAVRSGTELLSTAMQIGTDTVQYLPPPDIMPYSVSGDVGGPRPVARLGAASVILVNGVFGDPLLHLRLLHQRRSLLFDLGEAGRLPARIAHQITDIFISHAHIDHIGGFLWLLRSRMGEFLPCRLYGPPALADHIAGLLEGILWDRIGDRGPQFEIAELHDDYLKRCQLQAGRRERVPLDELPVYEGIMLDEPAFRVRVAVLDHGTPVLAFAFEPSLQIHIRKERLVNRRLEPGPWLTELKQHIAAGQREAPVRLPDGNVERVGPLADDLALLAPGKRLVYATDLADTSANRERLGKLAHRAHTLFCEAAFAETEVEQSVRTGHLTARACGEIAAAAGVERLIPFHFSRRYEDEPERIYTEVAAVCSRVVVPPFLPPGDA